MSEWLCTNNLGSYASGTSSDRLTRRYHGLFVPALAPPLGRRVLLSKCDTSVDYDGVRVNLSTNEWRDGTIAPAGDRYALETRMDGGVAITIYIVADAVLERRIWMDAGAQRTNVRWALVASSGPVDVHLKAYANDRDYHGLTQAYDVGDAVTLERASARICLRYGTPWYLHAPGASFDALGAWYYGFRYARERERGLDDTEDLYAALSVHLRLERAGDFALVQASLDETFCEPLAEQRDVVEQRPAWIERLTAAAQTFIVKRGNGSSIIAGYHWFGDWGRDTMISLPGLTLAGGRYDIARDILLTFAGTVDCGMIPNRFPDSGEPPEYNTVDAALWFIEAVRLYYAQTNDRDLLATIFDALDSIVDCYAKGTRYGIRVDERDGLLAAGEPGVQLTWMDAKVGDWVVTPRIGKPVEVNALWYNALCAMDGFAQVLGRSPARYRDLGSRARASFARFWNDERSYPYDVLDGPDGHEAAIRPNAVFAVALAFRAFDNRRERAIVDRAARELWTPMGLRSLSDREPGYVGRYEGSPHDRDAAYHQGTVWPYLAGVFARAYANAYNDRAGALRFIVPLAHRLDDYGIGTLAEIADGDAPHAPRGCISQAWSVAETLRAWHALKEIER
jgi:predicted glycogen debranching enzyme